MAAMALDLPGLAEEARSNSTPAMREAQSRGVSLFTADKEGHVFERTADGHLFAVELRGDHLTRIREVA
jgi:hypothetical protein